MMKVGIVGVSGYSGLLALELLLKHPEVRVTYVSAHNTTGPVSEICPRLKGKINLFCAPYDLKKAAQGCDVIFLAVPHTTSMVITPGLLKAKKKVIDLSADYRLKKPKEYQKWYKVKHSDPSNLERAVYGLPELYREDIKKAKLVANPGCYPTAAILALAPLIAVKSSLIQSIIIDAKSGISGAGKKLVSDLLFVEVNENFKAYKVLKHQHAPEINYYLSRLSGNPVNVAFVPHLLPMSQGILETIYVRLKDKLSVEKLHDIYTKFYKTEKFVRLMEPGVQPEVKNVSGTNYCDLGFEVDAGKKLLVITSVIDNLMKGAASQAVQNMNIMCGFKETEGLG